MCRILAVIAKKPVDIECSFFHAEKPFKSFSRSNQDGWGIGWYKDKKPKIFKEGKLKHHHFEKIKKINSKIIISHVRRATVGNKKKVNAHPFSYKNFIFAHNGEIDRKLVYHHLNKKFRSLIKGTADSELYFLLIMQFFEETKDIILSIKKTVAIAKKSVSPSLNFLLSDGRNLFAYRYSLKDKSDFHLHYLKQKLIKHKIEYRSKKTNEKIMIKCLHKEKPVIFSSEPLIKREDWPLMKSRQLIMVSPNLEFTIRKV